MLRSPYLPTTAALLTALSFAACNPGERDIQHTAPRCGSAGNAIDARQLLDRPEQEAVEEGRRHGCTVRVELRDDKTVASADWGYDAIGVAVRDGYLIGLCVEHRSDGKCSPLRGSLTPGSGLRAPD